MGHVVCALRVSGEAPWVGLVAWPLAPVAPAPCYLRGHGPGPPGARPAALALLRPQEPLSQFSAYFPGSPSSVSSLCCSSASPVKSLFRINSRGFQRLFSILHSKKEFPDLSPLPSPPSPSPPHTHTHTHTHTHCKSKAPENNSSP